MYLRSILTTGILCAVADSLMPPGAVKRVGQLVCGLVLMCAVLTPLIGLDPALGERWMQGYFAELEQDKKMLESQVEQEMKVIIERECAAYISDKAAELGAECRARVTCRTGEDGLPIPWEAEVTGLPEGAVRKKLVGLIREELGIPEQRQRYLPGEEDAL